MSPSPSLQIIQSEPVEVAPGFVVHRAMPLRGFRGVDPYLLLDHFGPQRFREDSVHGVPVHPHRGFVAVTYMLSGAMRHKDSIGNDLLVAPGDLNWVSTAYGLQHSETPELDFSQGDAEMQGFQIWVNLPAKHKLGTPRLQHLRSDRVPLVEKQGSRVKVLVGKYMDQRSPIETFTELQLLHIELEPNASIELHFSDGFNACLYVVQGEGSLGSQGESVRHRELVCFPEGLNTIEIRNTSTALFSLLSLGAKPIGEKVFAHGPFVMNSFEEIQDAIRDYERGEMGFLS